MNVKYTQMKAKCNLIEWTNMCEFNSCRASHDSCS